MPTRLQKFIAHAGRASRRKSEELIRGGRVRVNGHVAQLGSSVDEKHDMVEVDGIQLRPPAQHKYIMLHKPTGYVSTKARFPHQKSVYELVPDSDSLALAGRLDKDSSGLLLLTNDGDLIFQITHPSFHHSKIYDALLAKSLTQIQLDRLSKGVQLEEGIAKFDAMRQIVRHGIASHCIKDGNVRCVVCSLKLVSKCVSYSESNSDDFHLVTFQKVNIRKLQKATLSRHSSCLFEKSCHTIFHG